jgi:hypothetical protein
MTYRRILIIFLSLQKRQYSWHIFREECGKHELKVLLAVMRCRPFIKVGIMSTLCHTTRILDRYRPWRCDMLWTDTLNILYVYSAHAAKLVYWSISVIYTIHEQNTQYMVSLKHLFKVKLHQLVRGRKHHWLCISCVFWKNRCVFIVNAASRRQEEYCGKCKPQQVRCKGNLKRNTFYLTHTAIICMDIVRGCLLKLVMQ